MHIARRPLLVAAGLGLLLGPRLARPASRVVVGSGVAATQRRELGGFAGISLGAPFAVVLRARSRESVEIIADDNVLPLVRTQLRGAGRDRSLHLDLADDTRVEPLTPHRRRRRLHRPAIAGDRPGAGRIDAAAMNAARLEAAVGGAGTIELRDLDAGELAVSIGGSGAFRAAGRARKMAVNVAGSGRCDAERLVADEVSVSVAGSGDVRVHAETALRASIAGSGEVFHRGTAAPQVSIVGSGRLTRL